jgi:hypothetical protein
MRLLASGLPPAAAAVVEVVEKASIDEAYLLVALTASSARQAPSKVGGCGGRGGAAQ